jgi:hypothetical protein
MLKLRIDFFDRDPVLFYPLDPGWIFFRIPDLGSGPFFDEIFLSSESMLCYLYNTGLLLKLAHKTINSMKKLCLLLLPLFYIGLGSEIRDSG